MGENGRLLIDAWMSLNEAIRGPASFPSYEVDDQFRRRAEAYDRFQVAFKERLEQEGLAAVAFNFAAGNFTKPEHYLDWFPRTLEAYTYLGFHEYGWPSLKPGPDVATAALYYRACMEGIRQQYGDKFKVIMTEAGLTMAYGHPGNPDEGWLNTREPLTEEQYWQSRLWYNNEMLKDPDVMGACLFEVGHASKWQAFRHLGEDNQDNPILLMNRIEALNDIPGPVEPPEPPEPPSGDIYERVGKLVDALAHERDVIAGIPHQADAVERALTSLTGPAGQAVEAEMLAHNLRTRVNQIAATDPIALARALIARRDLPGLPYHFLVQGDGDAFWVESLETALGQTMKDDINQKGVAVALAGNFTNDPPPEHQLDAAAAIIARLIETYNLNVDADVIGRSEVDSVASPGKQWLQGANYKFTLLDKVRALL